MNANKILNQRLKKPSEERRFNIDLALITTKMMQHYGLGADVFELKTNTFWYLFKKMVDDIQRWQNKG